MSKTKSQESRKVVLYFRVSTQRQGASGLGLEAQRTAVSCCIKDAEVVGDFVEIESGKRLGRKGKNGKRRKVERPVLDAAVRLCQERGAELVIAQLDRLARDVQTIFALRDSGVRITACDLPEFNTLTLGIFAAFAQYEAEKISERTTRALREKRAKDPTEWRKPRITEEHRAKGREVRSQRARANENNRRAAAFLAVLADKPLTLAQKAELLNQSGFRTSTGKSFYPASVSRLTAVAMESSSS